MKQVEEKTLSDAHVGVPNRVVAGRDSFAAVTRRPREIASLYFFGVLDFLIEVTRLVAADFFRRPQLYLDLGDDDSAAGQLARLHSRCGSDESVPSREQRAAVFGPLFGDFFSAAAPGDQDFHRFSGDLMRAVVAYVERQVDTSVEMLREQVRIDHRPFRDYLVQLEGASVRWSAEVTLATITEAVAYSILRNQGVAAVFGISSPPRGDWPYLEDPNGGKLVEEISKQLPPVHVGNSWTRERVSSIQRVALRGCEAISTTLDVQDDADNSDLDLLISKVYSWWAALRAVTTPPS